jgi:hypothetical protein
VRGLGKASFFGVTGKACCDARGVSLHAGVCHKDVWQKVRSCSL